MIANNYAIKSQKSALRGDLKSTSATEEKSGEGYVQRLCWIYD